MKPMTFMIALVSAMTLSAPAYAGYAACDGMEGKELKKCEKAEKKKEKQNARSTPLLPSQVDASLAEYDAANPFAEEAYSVRFTATGIQTVDDYLVKAVAIKGTLVMARYMVDQAAAGEDITKTAPMLLELLKGLPEKGQALIEEGKGMANPDTLKGMLENPADIMKVPKLVPALTDAVDALTSSLKEVPSAIESVTGLIP